MTDYPILNLQGRTRSSWGQMPTLETRNPHLREILTNTPSNARIISLKNSPLEFKRDLPDLNYLLNKFAELTVLDLSGMADLGGTTSNTWLENTLFDYPNLKIVVFDTPMTTWKHPAIANWRQKINPLVLNRIIC
jgi:hypothetical protein